MTLVLPHLKFAGRLPKASDKSLFLCIRGQACDIGDAAKRVGGRYERIYCITAYTMQARMWISIHLMDIGYFGCSSVGIVQTLGVV